MRRRSLAFLVAACCAGAGTFAQERQHPTFKAGVQLVRIDVSVLDSKRQPVRGLQASDFTVLEDGKPRPVRSFEAVDHAAAAPPAVTASVTTTTGVATNQAGNDTSRLIFILMDRSIPPERPMIMARQIADAAVDAMAPGDLAAIVTTGTGTPQNLTSDRARLRKTIAASDWSQIPSQAQQDTDGQYDPLTDGACLCGLCVMDTITRIANEVRDVPRRKLLLFIGSNLIVQVGMKIGVSTGVGCEKLVKDSREKLFDALQTSGLTVHAIDPQGLASVGPAARATVPNGVENRDGRALNEQLARERADFMAAQGNLTVLPDLTGGRTVLNSNEPFRMVPEVLHESDAYYLLAFEPIEGAGDVRHTIQVTVARKGVEVHTARYIAPSSTTVPAAGTAAPASPLDRALTNLLPEAALPIDMSVAAFAGPDARHAYVGVTLNASAFATGPGSIPIEIAVLATDERGRRVGGARQAGTVQVPPAARSGGMTPFVELQTYLTLPPGSYELRAAVMNSDTQAVSSVFTHVTVPSFDDNRLGLSDIVLGTRTNTGALPDGAPAMPIVPTTTRVFSASDPATAFLRVYRTVGSVGNQPVSIDTSVVDSRGRRVRHQSLPAAAFVGRDADIRLGLPLKDLPAGRYVLRIDAKQGRAETSRAIAFDVTQAAPTLTQEHSPELDAALAAAARYVDQYEHRVSAISAEEAYEQAVQMPATAVVTSEPFGRRGRIDGGVPPAATTRKTRANITTIGLGARGWVSFRDVFEVDGHPVRDRIERLTRILQHVDPDSLQQARRIADESARYNLEPEGTRVDRTINVPMTALYFLRAANQPRSVFTLGRPERVDGVPCTTLQFVEQGRPRLIRTNDDAPAQGTFWIDMTNGGRVVKTELRIESAVVPGQSVRAHSVVTYAHVDKLDVWLPVDMNETYELTATHQTVTGHATYSDFREFNVTTSEGIK